jgi:hypothetical protein
MSTERREPDYSEVELDDEKRVQNALEEAGGLPENNPFTGTVEELREQGQSFTEIWRTLEELYDVVDKVAFVDEYKFEPRWEIAVKVPADTPSGYRYEYYERDGETAAEAERKVKEHTGLEVEASMTEQTGVSVMY